MSLNVQNLKKKFGNLIVFNDFSLQISEGKITCILGPSGCGKTTLLNIIGGLEPLDSGKLEGFENKIISHIFQEPRLIRWKTVWDNVDFVIKDIRTKDERRALITKYLEMVGLKDFKDYYTDKLSGGMQQRTAIARAFVYPADLIIMDEPFKGLDLKLKISVMEAFVKLWQEDKRTAIFVTHDIDEALYMGDEIYVLSSLPAQIRKTYSNEIPREGRRFRDSRNVEAEGKFFELITS
ncbi:MAG: ABC transporter ATP-binding protein [Deltaproteobacteria bacterium]